MQDDFFYNGTPEGCNYCLGLPQENNNTRRLAPRSWGPSRETSFTIWRAAAAAVFSISLFHVGTVARELLLVSPPWLPLKCFSWNQGLGCSSNSPLRYDTTNSEKKYESGRYWAQSNWWVTVRKWYTRANLYRFFSRRVNSFIRIRLQELWTIRFV